ncbi:PhoH family protein [bacterium]|nr:PhoH family protein [bacterium]
MSPSRTPSSGSKKRSAPKSAAKVAKEALANEEKALTKKTKTNKQSTPASTTKAASTPSKAASRKSTQPSIDIVSVKGGNGTGKTNGNGVHAPTTPPLSKGAVESLRLTPREVDTKLFVLDTNVLLHDPTAINRFEEHDLAIPITVLEEVDRFKKGPDTLNFHAREVARHLDDLAPSGGLTSDEGVSLGDGRGRLRVMVGGALHPAVKATFLQDSPDHRILSTACKVRDANPSREVVLVSKDVSLRLKARALGMLSEDYENDKVPELDKLYKGRFELEHLDGGLIDRFYQPPFEVPVEEFGIETPHPNAYFVLKGDGKSALARYDRLSACLVRIEKRSGYGIMPRNSEQTFAIDALTNPDIKLLTLSGKAGTGKTLLALAGALETRRKYEQVYLARPVVPLGRQELGYLPGDISEKLDPYMQPLWDNLAVIRGQYKHSDSSYQAILKMLETEKLKINALAYIRGRSLNRIFFIVDEAQNLTPHEVKTIITRAGEGTKIVLTGDPHQIDSPYLDSRSNGLTRLIDRMKGQDIYAHVTLEKGERSELSDLASSLL